MIKKPILWTIQLVAASWNLPLYAQTEAGPSPQPEPQTETIGLPGDNLNLYAVLELFQKSKTIEEFEKTLNLEATGVNNLDLNLDSKVDFIRVETVQDKDDFSFILRVNVKEKESQDVAVILVSKDKAGKVSIQIVGDEALYGKNYIVDPQAEAKPTVTPNPAYTGPDKVVAPAPSTTTVVKVESAPIVTYVYSPVYVPYVPPPAPPPYFVAFTVVAVSAYHHNHYHHYHGYPPPHGNTVVIHNTNNYNHYSNNYKNTSNTVNHNNSSGKYPGSRNGTSKAGAGGVSGASPGTSDMKPKNNAGGNRATTDGDRKKASAEKANRPSAAPADRSAKQPSSSRASRPSVSPSSSSSRSSSRGSTDGGRGGGGRGGRRGGGRR